MAIQMPAGGWTPRDYQLDFWKFRRSGGRRAVLCWPRRHGKDHMCLNDMAVATQERVGLYLYVMPYQNQARRIVWDGIDKAGRKFLDAFPAEIIERKLDGEMKLHLKNGSVFQVIGGDDPDKLVGANPIGIVFSEYALTNPRCWQLVSPILRENDGWAVFNSTPRGKNHFLNLLNFGKSKAWRTLRTGGFEKPTGTDWYWSHETAATLGVLSPEDLRELRDELGDEQLFQQEAFCSFDIPLQGAYYASQFASLDKGNQITSVPVDRRLPVHTAWDLGISDSTSIWFFQQVGREIRIVNYMEMSGEGLITAIGDVKTWLRDKGVVGGVNYGPHDLTVRELTSGKSRLETSRLAGFPFRVVQKHSLEDGIEAVRNILSQCWFDAPCCERGLSALRSYRKEWDDNNKTFRNRPLHDWASHGADAFRYLAFGVRIVEGRQKDKHPKSYAAGDGAPPSVYSWGA